MSGKSKAAAAATSRSTNPFFVAKQYTDKKKAENKVGPQSANKPNSHVENNEKTRAHQQRLAAMYGGFSGPGGLELSSTGEGSGGKGAGIPLRGLSIGRVPDGRVNLGVMPFEARDAALARRVAGGPPIGAKSKHALAAHYSPGKRAQGKPSAMAHAPVKKTSVPKPDVTYEQVRPPLPIEVKRRGDAIFKGYGVKTNSRFEIGTWDKPGDVGQHDPLRWFNPEALEKSEKPKEPPKKVSGKVKPPVGEIYIDAQGNRRMDLD